MDDFIEVYPDAVPAAACRQMVAQFEASGQAAPGRTSTGVDVAVKNSSDITISGKPEWQAANALLQKAAFDGLKRYVKKYPFLLIGPLALRLPHPTTGEVMLLTADTFPQVTDEQFRQLLVRTYSGALTQYRDHTMDYKPLRADANATDVTVRTEVVRKGQAPVQIDYSMARTPVGWKVYDVIVAGVSLVTNYRDEFNEQVKSGGVDGLIKSLVAGDPMMVEAKYGRPYTMVPKLKLFVAANHKPAADFDRAFKERLIAVPFEFKADEAGVLDESLYEKLLEEIDGFFSLLVMGCTAWQTDRMLRTDEMVELTNEYEEENDDVQRFIDEQCIVNNADFVEFKYLYAAWKEWAEINKAFVLSSTKFGNVLSTKGFEPAKIGKDRARGRQGLRLRGSMDL